MNNEEVRVDGKMAFKPEEREEMLEFIKFLIKMNAEFRVWTDGYCHVVEYFEDASRDYYNFTPIDADHYITPYAADGNDEDNDFDICDDDDECNYNEDDDFDKFDDDEYYDDETE